MKRSTTNSKWPCIFVGETRLAAADAILFTDTPVGAVMNVWRTQHCERINPYGSDDCPFTKLGCLLAFKDALNAQYYEGYAESRGQLVARFAIEAAHSGMNRAENRPSQPRTQAPGTDSGSDVRRSLARPSRIGSLLGQIDPRSRQGSAEDGQEGPV